MTDHKTYEPPPACTAREYYDPFRGSNQEYEVETFEEFQLLVEQERSKGAQRVSLSGWMLQEVDFSSLSLGEWKSLDLERASFWGCTFPESVTSAHVRSRGAHVMENPPNIPFKPYRAFMYRQDELREMDKQIYEHSRDSSRTFDVTISRSIHDHSIMDALLDYLEGKTPVSIMGGHALSRSSPRYERVVDLGRKLALAGFVTTTGGGPGAMEAANLGAYACLFSPQQLQRALQLLRVGNDTVEHEYDNVKAARSVLEEFGDPSHMPSLGIPTYRYGHEPSNCFATWHAKFFENATREDALLQICIGGIVITPGGPGTMQEVMQSACINHYGPPEKQYPMVFYGVDFWASHGLYGIVKRQSHGHPYGDMMLLTDDVDEIIEHLHHHACRRKLRLIRDLEAYKQPFWLSKSIQGDDNDDE